MVAPEEAPVEASSQNTEEQPAFETLPVPDAEPEPSIIDVLPTDTGDAGLRLGPRGGSTRRRGGDGPPPFFEGQTAGAPTVQASEAPPSTGSFDTTGLGLPTAPDAIVRYLTHRYKGVGEKTAETLVDRFGTDLFRAMQEDPEAISTAIPSSRAEQVLEAWRADYARRSGGSGGGGSNRGRS